MDPSYHARREDIHIDSSSNCLSLQGGKHESLTTLLLPSGVNERGPYSLPNPHRRIPIRPADGPPNRLSSRARYERVALIAHLERDDVRIPRPSRNTATLQTRR